VLAVSPPAIVISQLDIRVRTGKEGDVTLHPHPCFRIVDQPGDVLLVVAIELINVVSKGFAIEQRFRRRRRGEGQWCQQKRTSFHPTLRNRTAGQGLLGNLNRDFPWCAPSRRVTVMFQRSMTPA
jgi:hypothetical protein